MENYNPPVTGLLTLGRPLQAKHPTDYLALGIGPEHVPDLLRLRQDEELFNIDEAVEDDPRWYAQIHAWRALGQLRAPEAVEPLLDLIDENEDADEDWSDWITEELPAVLGRFGPSIFPTVVARIERRKGQYAAAIFANVLVQLAQHHPETRPEVVQTLCRILETAVTNDPTLNGFIVADLLDLSATEAWPTIEAAFATNNVEEDIVGDADDVKYALGLSPKPGRYSAPRYKASPHPTGQNAKQRFNERQRQKKLAKKQKKKRK